MVWAQKPVDPSLWAQKKNQTKLPSVWAEKIGGGNRIVFGGGVVDSVGTESILVPLETTLVAPE